MSKPRLDLKPVPDGFGFLYGTLTAPDGSAYRVDIMPPLTHWSGDMKLTGSGAPHPTDWVLYVEGQEIARARQHDELATAALTKLPPRS